MRRTENDERNNRQGRQDRQGADDTHAHGRSFVCGRTVHAGLKCYRTVNPGSETVLGLRVFTKN